MVPFPVPGDGQYPGHTHPGSAGCLRPTHTRLYTPGREPDVASDHPGSLLQLARPKPGPESSHTQVSSTQWPPAFHQPSRGDSSPGSSHPGILVPLSFPSHPKLVAPRSPPCSCPALRSPVETLLPRAAAKAPRAVKTRGGRRQKGASWGWEVVGRGQGPLPRHPPFPVSGREAWVPSCLVSGLCGEHQSLPEQAPQSRSAPPRPRPASPGAQASRLRSADSAPRATARALPPPRPLTRCLRQCLRADGRTDRAAHWTRGPRKRPPPARPPRPTPAPPPALRRIPESAPGGGTPTPRLLRPEPATGPHPVPRGAAWSRLRAPGQSSPKAWVLGQLTLMFGPQAYLVTPDPRSKCHPVHLEPT